MNEQNFYRNDIAVIAYSCVLPGASNPEDFWKNCLDAKSVVQSISDRRLKKYLISKVKDITQDRIYSTLACEIAQTEYERFVRENILEVEDANRLSAYTFEALRQLVPQIKKRSQANRTDLILGCMNPDADHEIKVILDSKKDHQEELTKRLIVPEAEKEAVRELFELLVDDMAKDLCVSEHSFFASHLLSRACERFEISGEHFLVDAACASSLASIDISMQRLKLGQSDLVIAGGIESNLGHGAYMVFSKVGALAENKSLPFDKNTEGLVQGEGAVLFALKRLDDAIRDGEKIHGVIRAVAGSSDGRSASLFQPNAKGQRLVYERVYGKQNQIDYLEAHGTGTPVGDKTEMESISEFFLKKNLPVGSVKSILGHAKGAAGGAGILKCLLIIKNRIIPPSPYVKDPIFPEREVGPYLNTEKITLQEGHRLRLGVNSFGFGGTNYHLLLEEFAGQTTLAEPKSYPTQIVGEISSSSKSLLEFSRDDFFKYPMPFRLPPTSVKATDKTQLLALITSWDCIKSLGDLWNFVPKEKINVISACTLCLDQVFELTHRLVFEMISSEAEMRFENKKLSTVLREDVETNLKPHYAPINEDAATGILNNVIAGRVANVFDLFGKSSNIDKNIVSVPVALEVIHNELQINPDQLFIFIGIEETFDEPNEKTIRQAVTTRLITSEKFAFQHELPLNNIYAMKK